ncbi:MAG: peptide ABC transporter substrate-binding protein [Anaerolineales bacterium]|nr:peptide ABC transporter substrate-binding protein [Anaerolineales bacterium]
MPNRTWFRAIQALAALSLVLAACAAPTAAPSPTQAPGSTEAAPAASQVLRWAIEGVNELPSIDPPTVGASQSVAVASLVFEGLVKLDGKLNVVPAGAESWEIKDGGKTFVFHIRPGLKFANGDPVTAEDFAYALNRAFSPELSANWAAGYFLSNIAGAMDVQAGTAPSISGVQVLDPQTLQIGLNVPATVFLYQLTFPTSFVIPKPAVEADPAAWTDHAYGTGPFMVKEWKHNQSITLVPNPNYWAGKVQLSEIQMPFIQDAATALKLYQTGELDIMGSFNFPTDQIPAVKDLPDFKQLNQFFVTYIGFNNAQPPFSDVRVRQAFAQGFDKDVLVNQVLEGAMVRADTLIPPGMPGFNANVQVQKFDAAGAQKLLADAGYPGGAGFPAIAFSVNDQDPNYAKIAAFLQQQWKENLGVDITINTLELSKFNEDLTATANDPTAAGALTFYLSVWGADYPDPQNFVSQQLRTGVGNNNGHYSNAEFDKLVDAADVEPDLAKRLPMYQQAEQIALNEVGWLPLFYGKQNLLLNPKVQGLSVTAQGLFPVTDWTAVTVAP